jgi:hypothetical protein
VAADDLPSPLDPLKDGIDRMLRWGRAAGAEGQC